MQQKSATDLGANVDAILEESKGFLKLKPNYVRRYYRDGDRLSATREAESSGQHMSGSWRPERWIASTVTAYNPQPIPGEGLSFLNYPGEALSLKEALSLWGEALLGPDLAQRYQSDFPLLSKVFDPYHPIFVHFHARDEDVRRYPEHFAPNLKGKEEA